MGGAIADEDNFAHETCLEQGEGAGGSDVTTSEDGDACVVRGHGASFHSDICAHFRGVRMYLTPCLLTEFNLGCALTSLILWRLGDSGDVGMAAEILAERAAKHSHSGAVDDSDARKAGEESAVNKAFDLGLCLVGSAAEHIDLRSHVIGVVIGRCDGYTSAFAGGLEGRYNFDGLHVGNITYGGAHLQLANGNFEGLRVDDAVDPCLTTERFEFHEVADFNALWDVGLGGGIVLVGASGVGDDGGVELFGELPAQGGHTAIRVAGDLLRESFVVDSSDRFAELIGEVFDQRVEFGFEFPGASLLFEATFDFETSPFTR